MGLASMALSVVAASSLALAGVPPTAPRCGRQQRYGAAYMPLCFAGGDGRNRGEGVPRGRSSAALRSRGGGGYGDDTAGSPFTLPPNQPGKTQEQPHVTKFISECELPTSRGTFRLRAYSYVGPDRTLEPVVLIAGDISSGENMPLRVHDQCFTSEVLGSMRCDCREQLDMSMDYIAQNGGAIIYMQQEGRGIGLANKIAAYALQDQGLDTVDANRHLGFSDDLRSYEAVDFILGDLGVKSVHLMTNNPFKIKCLKAMGVQVHSRIPMVVPPNAYSRRYLQAKETRMQHMLSMDDEGEVMQSMSPPKDVLVSSTINIRGGRQGGETAAAAAAAAAGDDFVAEGSPVEDGQEEMWAYGRDSVLEAIQAVGRGEIIVVTDDEDRENEGDLVMAADCATPEAMAFFVRYSSGVICASLTAERCAELKLPAMVPENQDPKKTAFTVTVDAAAGVSTGISAADRSHTLKLLADAKSGARDFNRPGHIFPLVYCKGGVLKRPGHTEASVDLSVLAGRAPVGVLCEITTADGLGMARGEELRRFCDEHKLVLTSIRDLRCYLRQEGFQLGLTGDRLSSSSPLDETASSAVGASPGHNIGGGTTSSGTTSGSSSSSTRPVMP
jgi:3,4-dihydroxy-2-butanone 4-phosphate synthase/GTP cyclohydrolase II